MRIVTAVGFGLLFAFILVAGAWFFADREPLVSWRARMGDQDAILTMAHSAGLAGRLEEFFYWTGKLDPVTPETIDSVVQDESVKRVIRKLWEIKEMK